MVEGDFARAAPVAIDHDNGAVVAALGPALQHHQIGVVPLCSTPLRALLVQSRDRPFHRIDLGNECR